MKPRLANPVKIGVFVIGGLVILVGAVLWIGSGRFFRRTHPFVSFFDGTVNGLRAGASVKFKGVEIGKVDRIRIPEGLTNTDQPIAVFFSLDGDKLDATGAHLPALLGDAISNGLRAQLEAESMVTGILFVSLVFLPGTQTHVHAAKEGVIEIPTIPPPLQEIGAGIRSIVDRIARYPFERVLDSLRAALDGFTDLSKLPEIRDSLTSLTETLGCIRTTVQRIDQHVDPLAAQLATALERADVVGGDLQSGIGDVRATLGRVRVLSEELSAAVRPLVDSLDETSGRLQRMALALQTAVESTRVLLDPQAPLAVELRAGLREISDTARATRALFELLERDPGALVRGRGKLEGSSK